MRLEMGHMIICNREFGLFMTPSVEHGGSNNVKDLIMLIDHDERCLIIAEPLRGGLAGHTSVRCLTSNGTLGWLVLSSNDVREMTMCGEM